MVAHPRRSANFRIEQPRLLLVEGNDDVQFFRRIIQLRQSEGMQVIEFGGKDKLGEFLTNVLVPRVSATDIVRIIGVVRDADCDYDRAFQSVGDSLRRAGLPVPGAPVTCADGSLDSATLQVSVYIMPDNAAGGDLETLILRAVEGSPALDCVDTYIECLKERGMVVPHRTQSQVARLPCLRSGRPHSTTRPGDRCRRHTMEQPGFLRRPSVSGHVGRRLTIRRFAILASIIASRYSAPRAAPGPGPSRPAPGGRRCSGGSGRWRWCIPCRHRRRRRRCRGRTD